MFIDTIDEVHFSVRNALILALSCIILYTVLLTIYRLHFSPLAHFPGPKISAATGWYETYYQIVKDGGGQFTFKIAKWHEQYGPILRISPHELHISDPSYIETIYSNGKAIDKPDYFSHQFGTPGSIFGTVPHELHKQRKAAIQPLFSTQRVSEQLPQILDQAAKLSKRVSDEYAGTQQVLNLGDMLSCFAGDVIMKFAFDREFKYLDSPDFRNPFTASFVGFKAFAHYTIQFPWLPRLLAKLPDAVAVILNPDLKPIVEYKHNMTAQINAIKQARDKGENNPAKGTIFNEVLDSNLPASEKTTTRLSDEAAGIVGGGIETTKWSATVMCFHIINNPPIHSRLRDELKNAFPDGFEVHELAQLENLPYLMACVKEGLRLSYGSMTRSPRIHRNKALLYRSYTIPPGTLVSTDAWHAHHNERVFPDSFEYIPERWLGNPKGLDGEKKLSTYALYFGRGTRMCLGMHLVYAELAIIIAMLFRSFEFDLFETDRTDVDCHFDQIAPGVKPGSKGVRVLVKSGLP
ncbi:Cytochrome P450 [Glarea lozoyensis ATCC 20868]|uniref:Cytochrome P450 n=1 Tax=Glarea lozoyensis (strain ATCC 20868 / MF5171) TaxID=1116229 RepID=S3CFX5_GLAL2|nr:Cytochrome P450 [Glarea lozoyensis ATCC 20868]EPE24159.1 Cytochrome P450 [Glarea lozoyensis ATCC 20868]